jgi:hypothetical protein
VHKLQLIINVQMYRHIVVTYQHAGTEVHTLMCTSTYIGDPVNAPVRRSACSESKNPFIWLVQVLARSCQYIMAVNKKIEEGLGHIKTAEKR